jgi:hypothetical protein
MEPVRCDRREKLTPTLLLREKRAADSGRDASRLNRRHEAPEMVSEGVGQGDGFREKSGGAGGERERHGLLVEVEADQAEGDAAGAREGGEGLLEGRVFAGRDGPLGECDCGEANREPAAKPQRREAAVGGHGGSAQEFAAAGGRDVQVCWFPHDGHNRKRAPQNRQPVEAHGPVIEAQDRERRPLQRDAVDRARPERFESGIEDVEERGVEHWRMGSQRSQNIRHLARLWRKAWRGS